MRSTPPSAQTIETPRGANRRDGRDTRELCEQHEALDQPWINGGRYRPPERRRVADPVRAEVGNDAHDPRALSTRIAVGSSASNMKPVIQGRPTASRQAG